MTEQASQPSRRNFLKYTATGAAALVIGAVGGYMVGGGGTTQTITSTSTLPGTTTTVTATTTTTATATTTTTPYPTTVDGLNAMISATSTTLFNKLVARAKASSVDWAQFKGQISSLNCSMRQGPDNDIYTKLMAPAFKEVSGIDINFDLTPEVQQREKVSVDILSKTGVYHLPMIDNMHLPKYVQANTMEGLQQYMQDSKLTDADFFKPNDWYPMVLKGANCPPYGATGEMYAIPNIFHNTMQYYRKDVFDANGLTVADIDTFDALKATAKILNNPSKSFYGFSSRGMRGEGMNIFTWQTWHRGMGGQWFDDKWKPLVDQPETVTAVTEYVDLMDTYGPPGVENYDFSATLSSAGGGKVAIGLDCDCWGPLLWNPTNAQPPALGNMFSYRVPTGKAGKHAGFFFWSFGVPSGIKTVAEKKATWLWAEFCHSPEGIAAIEASELEPIPSRPSVWDFPEFAAICPPNDFRKYKALTQEQDSYFDDRPAIPEWPEVGDAMGVALSSALSHEMTPQDACNSAQAAILKIMTDAGYYK